MIRRTVTGLIAVELLVVLSAVGLGIVAVLAPSPAAGIAALVHLALAIILGLATAAILARRLAGRLDALSTRASNLTGRLNAAREEVVTLQGELETVTGRLAAAEDSARRSRDELRILRKRVPSGFLDTVRKDVRQLAKRSLMPRRLAFESALQLGREPAALVDDAEAKELFRDYLLREQYLALQPLIENFDVLEGRSLTQLRTLFQYFRRTGYWELATVVAERLHATTGRENDQRAVQKVRRELDVFTEPTSVTTALPVGAPYDPAGPILHMVGRVLPDTQTGYTLRTQYTAAAQARRGMRPVIVGQSGIAEGSEDGGRRWQVEGIEYVLLPGERRNEVPLDVWLRSNMEALADLVLELRPSVLHAQSDFFNALIVDVVGKHFGIPTVYETRGFWEESWLSRVVNANGWAPVHRTLFAMYGLPSAYTLRRHAEEQVRLQPDHVFTLAEVMRDHILESAHGAIEPGRVSIVPNAVDVDAFPIQTRDEEFAEGLGIPSEAVTIGYISSLVEYEGIDTLIEAFRITRATSSRPLRLLIVGDGDYAATLRAQVVSAGIEDVQFTGRVPHEDVLRYYGLIDVFVVPRKKSDVTDLVTPLKPFEAFATGRAVVLSDVGALLEIADQCGSVDTFRAGDAEDLARVLRHLVADPERRRVLAEGAARWVRNHRAWDHNVAEYHRVYRALGYAGPRDLVSESEVALVERSMNPGELVEAMAHRELPPMTGWFSLQEMRQQGEQILGEGWRYEDREPVDVVRLEDWARYGRENRSWGYNLHAWKFMEPLLREYDATGDRDWLLAAIDIARRWIDIHRAPGDQDDPMVWYDMSLALRTPMLLALTLRTARVPELRDDTVVLIEELCRHADELATDAAFNPNNNHGFYVAASQLHLVLHAPGLPGTPRTRRLGEERLARMATSQFAADGVHLEHSPDYHRMLLGSFERAIADGIITDPSVKQRIERAAHVLGWMVQPDGTILQFGDSPQTRMVLKNAQSIDEETLFVLSDGKRGTPPASEMAVFREGGYAFVRSPRPQTPGSLRDSGYLAFSAAFHSRAHKHADDLTVVWTDRRQEILVDAGRYGYGALLPPESPQRQQGFYYASEERQFVESTRAHNTLMVDDRDHERRFREPYGSGITECAEREGNFDLSGRVHHSDYIHRRRLVYRPGEELLLKDSIFSQSPDTRTAVLWFNVAGHFELESDGDELSFVSRGNDGCRLTVEGPGTLLEPVLGAREPLRGWRSRRDGELEPAWSLGFRFPVEVRASVDTVLRLS